MIDPEIERIISNMGTVRVSLDKDGKMREERTEQKQALTEDDFNYFANWIASPPTVDSGQEG